MDLSIRSSSQVVDDSYHPLEQNAEDWVPTDNNSKELEQQLPSVDPGHVTEHVTLDDDVQTKVVSTTTIFSPTVISDDVMVTIDDDDAEQCPSALTSPTARHVEHRDVIAALRSVIAASRRRSSSASSMQSSMTYRGRRRRFAIRRPPSISVDQRASDGTQSQPVVRGSRLNRTQPSAARRAYRSRGVAPLSLRQFFENGGRNYDEYLSKIIETQQQQQQQQQQDADISCKHPVGSGSASPDTGIQFDISPSYHQSHQLCQPTGDTNRFDKPPPPPPPYTACLPRTTSGGSVTSSVTSPIAPSIRLLLESPPIGRPPACSSLYSIIVPTNGDTPTYSTTDNSDVICHVGDSRNNQLLPELKRPIGSSHSPSACDVGVLDLSAKEQPISDLRMSNYGRPRGSPRLTTRPVTDSALVYRTAVQTTDNGAQQQQVMTSAAPRPPAAQNGAMFCNDVRSWTIDEVVRFVQLVPGCNEYAETFRREKIDGVSFAHLSDEHLLNVLKMRLGPALRLRIAIDVVRRGGATAARAADSTAAIRIS